MVLDKASEFFLCIHNYLVKLVGTIFFNQIYTRLSRFHGEIMDFFLIGEGFARYMGGFSFVKLKWGGFCKISGGLHRAAPNKNTFTPLHLNSLVVT